MDSNDDKPVEVGFGKPPKSTQFKKGQSGNPKGRPKGKLNSATLILRTFHQKVVINEKGQRRKVTKLQAALMQLVNKAAAGDLRALNLATQLLRFAEERNPQETSTETRWQDADKGVLEGLMQRIDAITEEGNSADKEDGNDADSAAEREED